MILSINSIPLNERLGYIHLLRIHPNAFSGKDYQYFKAADRDTPLVSVIHTPTFHALFSQDLNFLLKLSLKVIQ